MNIKLFKKLIREAVIEALHEELPDIINETLDHMKNASFKIVLIHVRAHTGKKDPHSIANEIVDDLAKKGAMKNN